MLVPSYSRDCVVPQSCVARGLPHAMAAEAAPGTESQLRSGMGVRVTEKEKDQNYMKSKRLGVLRMFSEPPEHAGPSPLLIKTL